MAFVKTGDEGRIMKIIKADDGENEIVEIKPGSPIEELKEKEAPKKSEDGLRGKTVHVAYLDDKNLIVH